MGKAGQKKKKVSSNRGFATTSVPSKKKEIEEEELKEDEKVVDIVEEAANQNGGLGNGEANQGSETKDEWDSEAMALQLLVEKIRPGIDKEVSRMGKVILGLDIVRSLYSKVDLLSSRFSNMNVE